MDVELEINIEGSAMSKLLFAQFRLGLFLILCGTTAVQAQDRSGSIAGSVKDNTQGVLQGARVELHPDGQAAVSNGQGQFTITGVATGHYTLTVSYIGFTPFSAEVNVVAGQTVNVDAVLQVAKTSEEVNVVAGRQFGELEALNRERVADNILQVLPANVITSLPNTNIADSVGRLPSVSLERDEGEGKYIQIRGTEPRLSDVTINGIHVPSPENVRNVKLDAIPVDLIDSIELSKTLSANQDADAIGGSVNLVTKSAAARPYLTLLGMGGYTPIAGGRRLDQFAGTAGNRFGTQKRLGIIFGGSYDFNARGIDDLEPAPTFNGFLPDNGKTFLGPNTADLREYRYDRSRYGFGGGVDYKLGDMSSIYLKGLFSHFNDHGEDWIYSPGISNFISDATDTTDNTCKLTSTEVGSSLPVGCGSIGFTDVFRQPEQQILSIQVGARHLFGSTVLNYEIALSQAKALAAYPRASFDGPGASDNSVAFAVDTSRPFTPKFPVLHGENLYDASTYGLTRVSFQHDSTFERDVVGDISLNKQYRAGSHYSSFEVGFKTWDARKTQIFSESSFTSSTNPLMSSFLSSFTNHNYYLGGRYHYGPTTDFKKILAYFNANQGQFAGGFDQMRSWPNDFDDSERIYAGYAMNTISFGRLRLQTGLRVEATNDTLLGTAVDTTITPLTPTPVRAQHNYTNVFPSVQAQYRIGSDTILRGSYGMGIARPNFYDMSPYRTNDPSSNPPISTGNPSLKPTHGQNFDILLERYLKPVGILQFGAFYKYLTDPIYRVTIQDGQVGTLINGPSAHVAGIEMSWQQQLRFLPGLLNGMGVSANYSHTTSRASFPDGFGRTDHPTLLRTAPNNWNFDVTYDKRGLSARMGLTHNDGYIWSYVNNNAVKDPSGDTYLYPHTQVDAQVSYMIPRSHGLHAIVSMLNLNNEVFGFYNGSETYPIQREYYNRTVSAGLRWTLHGDK